MSLAFTVSDIIPASPEEVYDAWLESDGHSKMTGAEAIVDPLVGGRFTAWDGYISGENIELERGKRIVQSWRTSDFEDSEPDSRLEVVLEPFGDGCKATIHHTDLPPHGTQYESGWVDHYLEPMKKYFGG